MTTSKMVRVAFQRRFGEHLFAQARVERDVAVDFTVDVKIRRALLGVMVR